MTEPSQRQLEKHIRASAKHSANVVLTTHAQQRMRQRRITLAMVLDVLQHGTLSRPPEPDMHHTGLKCEMRRYVGGMNVAAVVYVEYPAPGLLVVTVINIERA